MLVLPNVTLVLPEISLTRQTRVNPAPRHTLLGLPVRQGVNFAQVEQQLLAQA